MVANGPNSVNGMDCRFVMRYCWGLGIDRLINVESWGIVGSFFDIRS